MNRIVALLCLAALGLNTSCRSHESRTAMQSATRVLHEQRTANKTPALQYRFFSRDSVLFRYDDGLADIANGAVVSRSTTYNGFSVTKTFTALAILQLAEQGKLELDRPAADYLPDFPYPRDITVRHLLAHSAGIPNPIPLSWIHLQEEHQSFDRNAFFRALFARYPKVKASPNARFGYSNLGYVLLGQLIENVSGATYEQYVTDNILAPIGLSPDDLGFALNNTHQARGYHKRNSVSYLLLGFFLDKSKYFERREQAWQAFRPYYVNGAAYGGLIGTADGFARYVQALLDPASPLISDESRRLLFTENILSNGRLSGMSLGWHKGELDGQVYYAHAGGGGGYYAEVRIYPELQSGSVILFNRTGMSDERFLDRVDRYLIEPETVARR